VVYEFQGAGLLLVTGAWPTPDKPMVTFVPPDDPSTVNHSFTLRVADCQAAYELRARGADFLTPPYKGTSKIRCFCRARDGHLFEISQVA
jgi:hypothetical protein